MVKKLQYQLGLRNPCLQQNARGYILLKQNGEVELVFLDSSKLKQFADDNSKFDGNGR